MNSKTFVPLGVFHTKRHAIFLVDEVMETGNRKKNHDIYNVHNCLHPIKWVAAKKFNPPNGIQHQNTNWWLKRPVDYDYSYGIRIDRYETDIVGINKTIDYKNYENYIIVETVRDRLQIVINPEWIFGAFIDMLTRSPVRYVKYFVNGRMLTMDDLGKTYGELLREGIMENKCTVYIFQPGEKVEIPKYDSRC